MSGGYGGYRLPRGRHGLSREEVVANQRLRLIGAASEALAERRLGGLTSRLIARRAGVSSHTFYEHFADVDALLTAAFADAARLLIELVAAACDAGAPDPGAGRQSALAAALALGAEEPGLAALMRMEVAVAIPTVGADRVRLAARLGALAGGREAKSAGEPAVAGALALAVERLEADGGDNSALAEELGSLLG